MTCPKCGSSVEVYLNKITELAKCTVCETEVPIRLGKGHLGGELKTCICCGGESFYKQKDFNRKIGVALFILAAILSIWTYGISFIVLWLLDFFLFKKIGNIAICYYCETIYRKASNMEDLPGYDHLLGEKVSQEKMKKAGP